MANKKSPEQIRADFQDAIIACKNSGFTVRGTLHAGAQYFKDHPEDWEGIQEAGRDFWDAAGEGNLKEFWGEAWQELKEGFEQLIESPTDDSENNPKEIAEKAEAEKETKEQKEISEKEVKEPNESAMDR